MFVFWAGNNYCKINEVCKEFPKIRRALDVISQLLLAHEWTQEHLFVSSASPLGLTPEGKQMLEDSGFEEFFKANKSRFFDYIDLESPQSEAEVEKAMKDLMLYLEEKDMAKIELVEDFSYSSGRSVANILFAYSIEIRDRYLKERPFKPKRPSPD